MSSLASNLRRIKIQKLVQKINNNRLIADNTYSSFTGLQCDWKFSSDISEVVFVVNIMALVRRERCRELGPTFKVVLR